MSDIRALKLTGCPKNYSKEVLRARCSIQIDGVARFLPLAVCFDTFPQKEIAGYWLYGFEASYFVSQLKDLDPKGQYLGHWLIHSEEARGALGIVPNDGVLRAFRVRFVGVSPDVVGMPMAFYEHSYYAQRLLEVEQIGDPFEGIE